MLLILGESASKKDPGGVLTPKSQSGRRLEEWLGVLDPQSDWYVMKYNVSDISKGSLLRWKHNIDAILTLGVRAANHLYRWEIEHIRLPHPSGRNRIINDKEFVKRRLKEVAKQLEAKALIYDVKKAAKHECF